MSEAQPIAEAIQYSFRDIALLRLALTHPSIAQESGSAAAHNQRLEFLGDAVLQVTLSLELYRRFPRAAEGQLTKARARLVNRRFLAELGRQLNLGAHLVLSRGEEAHGGRHRPSSLADAFEAVLGAVFLDGGLEAATGVIGRLFRPTLNGWVDLEDVDNPKGELQEHLQAAALGPPDYRLEGMKGPDHDREFECTVIHGGVELGRGVGKSKKEAEGKAARAALDSLRTKPRSGVPSPPAAAG